MTMCRLFFGSLSRQADLWLSESESKRLNPTSAEPFFRRLLFYFAEHPLHHLAAICILALLVSAFCAEFTALTGLEKFISDYKKGDFLTFFTALWSLQATLAALVYPLIIAFVAVLLQRRASAKFSLRLYVLDAGIAPAGVSALAVVAWMTLQYFALPYVPLGYVAAAMAGNILWVLYNVLLTGWFIYRTVLFFDDDLRYRAFARYAARIAFRREAHLNLLGLMLSNAQDEGRLPKGADDIAPSGALVHVYPRSEGVPCVVRPNPAQKAVIDVRVRLMSWGIALWLRRQQARPDAQRYSERPVLTIPIVPGREADEQLVICRVKNGNPPGWIARFLLSRSVVLGPPIIGRASASTTEVLEELAVEALTLIEDARFEAAREVVEALVEVHTALVRAGTFINDEGRADHVGLLPSPYGFGVETIHRKWLGAYRGLGEVSVRLISSDMDVFSQQCYILQRLAIRLSKAPPEVLVTLVDIPDYLYSRLGQWWATQMSERGIGAYDINVGTVLPNPIQVTYERAVQTFVEGWEFAQVYSRDEDLLTPEQSWDTHSRFARFEGSKLNQLVYMILSAATRGDRTAASWLIDSLLVWASQSDVVSRHVMYDEDRYWMLDFASFKAQWSTVRRRLAIEDDDDESLHAKNAFETLLRTHWVDLRIVLIVLLLEWTDTTYAGTPFSLELAVALIRGVSPRTGQQILTPLTNPEAIFIRLLKMQNDGLIRNASELQRTSMVAGRVYSRTGADDLESLGTGQAMLLTIVISSSVGRSSLLDTLLARSGSDLRELSRFQLRANRLADSVDTLVGLGRSTVCTEARNQLEKSGTIVESTSWTIELLRAFAVRARAGYDEIVANSAISQSRLESIQQDVSTYAKSGRATEFPFTVCRSILAGASAEREASVSFTGISKESLAEPSLREWSPADAARYTPQVVKQIASSIVLEHLHLNNVAALPDNTEAEFADALENVASIIRQNGQTPVVLISHGGPDWTWPYRYPSPEPGPGVVSTKPPKVGDTNSVHSYLNGIQAHSLTIGEGKCFVVARESFSHICFVPHATDQCVTVTASEIRSNELKVTFTWYFWSEEPHP